MKKKFNKETIESLDDKVYNAADPFVDTSYQTFKDLLKERTILINGDIKESIIERAVFQITKMSEAHPKTPIYVVINSYGGSTFDGQALVDVMRSTKTPIITKVLGKAMSVAFDIFLAGDLRIVLENSVLLCHCGDQDLGQTKLSDSIDEAEFASALFKRWAKYYASRTNVSEKHWLEVLKSGKDVYFFPEECLKLGIAHEIQEFITEKNLPKPVHQHKKLSKKRKIKKSGKNKRKSRKKTK